MPEKKISIEQCKALIHDCDLKLSNDELEKLRDTIYSAATLLLEEYINSRTDGGVDTDESQ